MAQNFNKLRSRMTVSQRAESKALAREMVAEMLLSELRRGEGMTQEEVARILKIKQPSLSKLESQSDMQVRTLRRLIEALGGELELVAHMPGGDIRIRQFDHDRQD